MLRKYMVFGRNEIDHRLDGRVHDLEPQNNPDAEGDKGPLIRTYAKQQAKRDGERREAQVDADIALRAHGVKDAGPCVLERAGK